MPRRPSDEDLAEQLRGWYVDDGWTIRRIAEKLDVHEVTARRWMLDAGIELRPRGRRATDLQEVALRYRAGATTAELAVDYHVKVGTVQGWLHAAGVTERHPPQRRRIAELEDVEWLRRRYVTEGATLEAIADELGCVHATVWVALVRHGIPRRPRGPA